jgi:hypothetical protein
LFTDLCARRGGGRACAAALVRWAGHDFAHLKSALVSVLHVLQPKRTEGEGMDGSGFFALTNQHINTLIGQSRCINIAAFVSELTALVAIQAQDVLSSATVEVTATRKLSQFALV